MLPTSCSRSTAKVASVVRIAIFGADEGFAAEQDLAAGAEAEAVEGSAWPAAIVPKGGGLGSLWKK